ncbi:MAG: hypothetical protein GTO30_10045, partial [Acidobacteria bacterium]|nr:hypothetical protein [Acidobacteriota bacterium]NIQ86983.1 hypothetical protein [Acidobacteriota bacterium]
MRAGNNTYYGLQPVEDLSARLADENLAEPQRFNLLLRLSELETKHGRLADATAHADEALALIVDVASRSAPNPELPKAEA